MNALTTWAKGNGITLLDDNARYKNRMNIKSSSSNRLYVVAQDKHSHTWSCSCPGWVRHRHCKHLAHLEPTLKRLAG